MRCLHVNFYFLHAYTFTDIYVCVYWYQGCISISAGHITICPKTPSRLSIWPDIENPIFDISRYLAQKIFLAAASPKMLMQPMSKHNVPKMCKKTLDAKKTATADNNGERNNTSQVKSVTWKASILAKTFLQPKSHGVFILTVWKELQTNTRELFQFIQPLFQRPTSSKKMRNGPLATWGTTGVSLAHQQKCRKFSCSKAMSNVFLRLQGDSTYWE